MLDKTIRVLPDIQAKASLESVITSLNEETNLKILQIFNS